MYFFFLYSSRRFCRAFWFITVMTRAMDLRTVLLQSAYVRSVSARKQRGQSTHIRVSLAAEPPAIFCTRRLRSSFLSSESCFDKSFLDLSSSHAVQLCISPKALRNNALGLELVRLDLAGHFVV